MPIEITESAIKEIKHIIKSQEIDPSKAKLRLGVAGGGCAGFKYLFDIVEEEKENDERFEKDGIIILCDQKSYLYLNGTTVDFKDAVMGRGFVFTNPLSSGNCGCGSSFSV